MLGYNYFSRGKTAIAKMLLNPVVLHLKYSPDFVLVMCKQSGSCSKSVVLYCTVLEARMHDLQLSSNFQYCESLFKVSFHTQAFLTCCDIGLM
jgi:hypothetical protein